MNPIAQAVLRQRTERSPRPEEAERKAEVARTGDASPASESPEAHVTELRAGIDEIDGALLELLVERCRLARALSRTKRSADLPLVDHPREAEVVRRAGAAAREGGLDEELVRRLFWGVIELSRRVQEQGR